MKAKVVPLSYALPEDRSQYVRGRFSLVVIACLLGVAVLMQAMLLIADPGAAVGSWNERLQGFFLPAGVLFLATLPIALGMGVVLVLLRGQSKTKPDMLLLAFIGWLAYWVQAVALLAQVIIDVSDGLQGIH